MAAKSGTILTTLTAKLRCGFFSWKFFFIFFYNICPNKGSMWPAPRQTFRPISFVPGFWQSGKTHQDMTFLHVPVYKVVIFGS